MCLVQFCLFEALCEIITVDTTRYRKQLWGLEAWLALQAGVKCRKFRSTRRQVQWGKRNTRLSDKSSVLNPGLCHLPNASSRTSQLTDKFRFLIGLSTIYSLKILPSFSSIMYTFFLQGGFTGLSPFLCSSPLSCQLLESQGGIKYQH